MGKATHLYSMTAGIKLASSDAGRELSTPEELLRSTWCRIHHHNYCQQYEAKEQTGLSTNSSSFTDDYFLWRHLRLSLHSFFGWGGESLPQSLLKQGRVLSSFQPAFPITSSFCPLWVLHIGYIFSTGITQAPFIKTIKFRHGWVSSWLTRPCTGVSFSALAIFYFSLGFPCLPVSEPNQASLHYKLSAQGGTFPVENCRHDCPKQPNHPSAGLALTCLFPQNMAPECCPQRGCMKPSWARILARAVKFYSVATFLEKLSNTIDSAGLNHGYLLFIWRRDSMLENQRQFIWLTYSDIMLFEQKSNLAKAHQSKSPSSSYTYKQVHIRDRNVKCLLTFGNSSWPFSAVKLKI